MKLLPILCTTLKKKMNEMTSMLNSKKRKAEAEIIDLTFESEEEQVEDSEKQEEEIDLDEDEEDNDDDEEVNRCCRCNIAESEDNSLQGCDNDCGVFTCKTCKDLITDKCGFVCDFTCGNCCDGPYCYREGYNMCEFCGLNHNERCGCTSYDREEVEEDDDDDDDF